MGRVQNFDIWYVVLHSAFLQKLCKFCPWYQNRPCLKIHNFAFYLIGESLKFIFKTRFLVLVYQCPDGQAGGRAASTFCFSLLRPTVTEFGV